MTLIDLTCWLCEQRHIAQSRFGEIDANEQLNYPIRFDQAL